MSQTAFSEGDIQQKLLQEYGISEATLASIDGYVQLLLKWNKAKNLIGRSTEAEIWQRHILDSVQLLPLMPKQGVSISDFGCGAGLPGMILALCMPEATVHLIESNGKKTRFMTEAARQLKLTNVVVHNERIEALEPWKSDVITARAFAPLDELFSYIFPFFGKDSLCILPKGCNYKTELEEAQKTWKFDYSIVDSLVQGRDSTEKDGVIIRVNALKEVL